MGKFADKDNNQQSVDTVEQGNGVENEVDQVKPEVTETPKPQEPQQSQVQQPKVPRKFEPHESVEVYSNTHNDLVYVPSDGNGASYKWDKHGMMQLMSVQELLKMLGSQRSFFENQWVKIKDDAVAEYMHIKHYYDKEITDETIKGHLTHDTSETLNKFIDSANQNVKIKIIDIARDMVKTGELVNFHTVDVLEQRFGTTLKDLGA